MHIEIDPRAPTPPSEQIVEQVRFAIAAGHVDAGDRLPSVRRLAVSANVNPNTVAKAYRELEREGTVETRPGAGVFVAARAAGPCRAFREDVLAERIGRAVRDAFQSGLTPGEVLAIVNREMREQAHVGQAGGQR